MRLTVKMLQPLLLFAVIPFNANEVLSIDEASQVPGREFIRKGLPRSLAG
jgi:hypothetical protein